MHLVSECCECGDNVRIKEKLRRNVGFLYTDLKLLLNYVLVFSPSLKCKKEKADNL